MVRGDKIVNAPEAPGTAHRRHGDRGREVTTRGGRPRRRDANREQGKPIATTPSRARSSSGRCGSIWPDSNVGTKRWLERSGRRPDVPGSGSPQAGCPIVRDETAVPLFRRVPVRPSRLTEFWPVDRQRRLRAMDEVGEQHEKARHHEDGGDDGGPDGRQK